MRVLVIEDEQTLLAQLVRALTAQGYAVDTAENGEDGHYMGETEPYDVVVLDLGLPVLDGLTVLKRWRAAGLATPVLILTARSSWQEKVDGIDAGADDYLAKPFRMEELLARVRALIRRASGHASSELVCGPIRLDTRSSSVSVDGIPLSLTSHEYRLLAYLMHHQGKVVSRTELTEHLYAQDFDRDSNTIEVFIGRLRRKLGVDVIHTVRGLGYRMESRTETAQDPA
ncbi:response regulator [Novispirillum itersonii]|uniref:response regulator n=1 Tax=Novispirillum itersonii TaxID=189 RepID=UPI000368A9C8|nr:response regulator transcription factor [Novispirillum itersonii]